MKRTSFKILSIVVALAMIFATLPTMALAAGVLPPDETPSVHANFNFNYGTAGIFFQHDYSADSAIGVAVGINQTGTPARPGYAFAGWFLTPDCVGTASIVGTTTYNIVQDTEFYAKWTASDIAVTFDSNGGTAVADFAGKYDGLITKPADPMMAGFTFAGWYKDDNTFLLAWNFATDTLTAGIQLHAKWAGIGPGIQRVVDFKWNTLDAVASYTQVAVNDQAKVTAPAVSPAWTGYTFGGWYTTAACNVAFDFANTAIVGATSIFAKWIPIVYTVAYEENGGMTVADATKSYVAGVAPTLGALPMTTKAGYVLGNWYYDAAFTQVADLADKVTANVTVYAKWLSAYSVTFHRNDGSASDILGFVSAVTEGTTVAAVPGAIIVLGRTGYSNDGKWYTDAACTTEFKFGGAGVGTPVTSNVNLYVKWTADSNWAITYDTQGGSAVADGSVSPLGAKTVTKPADPIRSGYSFGYWSLAVGGAAFKFAGETGANVIAGPIKLYANWVATNGFRVTFVVGGVIYSAADYTAGSAYTIPADPSLAGSTFTVWNSAADGSGPNTLHYSGDHTGLGNPPAYTDRTVSGNVVWYAQFSQINYTVTYSTTRGTAPAAVPNKHINDTIAASPAVINPPAEYLFDGWYTSPNGAGAKWVFGGAGVGTAITGSITLYANWIPLFNVTLVPGGAGALQGTQAVVDNAAITWSAATIAVPTGSKLLVPDYGAAGGQQNPTAASSTFIGWFKDSLSGPQWTFGTNGDVVTGAVTLYAKYSVNQTAVVLYPNNGSAAIARSVDCTNNAASVVVDNPTLTGYTFAGWNDAANLSGTTYSTGIATGKVTLTIDGTVAGPQNFYAVWTVNDGTAKILTYRSGYIGLDSTPAANNYFNIMNVATGTIISSLPTISRTGWTFDGWYVDAGATVGVYDAGEVLAVAPLTINANTNLVAKWTINSYTVSFDPQGGAAVASIPANYGTSVVAPAYAPAGYKPGYSFGGWYKDMSCTIAYAFVGAATPDVVTSDITLFAKWLPIFTVSFIKDSALVNQASVISGDKVLNAVDDGFAPKAGYTFNGWFTQATGGTLFMAPGSDSVVVSASIVVFAQYTVIPGAASTVTFNSNGGSFVANQSVAPNGVAVLPAAPLKAGNVFKYWELHTAPGSAYVFSTPVVAAIQLDAVWEADKTITIRNLDDNANVLTYAAPYNSTIVVPQAPTTSNTFDWNGKWYTSNAYTTEYNFAAPITANVTLYPGHTGKYDVMLKVNGATSGADSHQYLVAGAKVAQPTDVSRTGYILEGWYVTTGGFVGMKWDFNGNSVPGAMTLSAKWVYAYSISYNFNYTGSVATTSSAMYNRLLTKPADPVRAGYIFQGWFTDAAAATHQWDFTYDKLMKNTVLFAKWAPVVITLGSYNTALTNQSITVGATTNFGTLNASYHTFAANGSFTFIVTDTAGNTIATKVVTITNIDKTLPVITVKTSKGVVVKAGATVKGVDLVVTVSDTNLLSKSVTLGGKAVTWPTSGKFTKHGTYIFTAKDKAGNVSTFKVILK